MNIMRELCRGIQYVYYTCRALFLLRLVMISQNTTILLGKEKIVVVVSHDASIIDHANTVCIHLKNGEIIQCLGRVNKAV